MNKDFMPFTLLVIMILSVSSCFTAGYTIVGRVAIPNAYSSKKAIVIPIMERFKSDHPELMIDSNFVNKYYKDVYFDLTQRTQVYQNKRKYPVFPEVNWAGLYTWHILSPDKTTIYELGLYASGFAISELGLISRENVTWVNHYTLKDMKKEGKALKKEYLDKFNNELLPLLRPFFIAIPIDSTKK